MSSVPAGPPERPGQGRVVVVGAGGAGLLAALAAREAGAEVLLLSKGQLGMGNCTAYAGGGFTAPVGGLGAEQYRAYTLETGHGLSEPGLLQAVSEDAGAAFERMGRWGVRYDLHRGGISVRRYSRGGLMGGTGLTLPLREQALRAGVRARTGVAVTAVLRSRGGEGPACGVELYDPEQDRLERVAADAVVVAAGGGGAAFPRTDNPPRTTGDGYRLLFSAGVELYDMEFVQWYPLGYAEPGFPVWMRGLPVIDEVPLENSAGERFLDRLLGEWGLRGGREANLFARDRAAIAVAQEYAAGREVRLRYDLLPPEKLAEVDPLAAACFERLGGPRPVRVAPLVHYFCGGALASADGVTSVPGLFACGEVVGGFDGANRIGGNALTALTVLSQRAGARAAASAAATAGERAGGAVAGAATAGSGAERAGDDSTVLACGGMEDLLRGWRQNLAERAAAAPTGAALRERIQAAVGSGLGLVKTAEGLRSCLDELMALRSVLRDLTPVSATDRLLAVECPSLLAVGELSATAALSRCESRGVHYRTDHPVEDEDWRVHLVLAAGGPLRSAAEPAVAAEPRRAAVGSLVPGRPA